MLCQAALEPGQNQGRLGKDTVRELVEKDGVS